jgi:hypothetical protein
MPPIYRNPGASHARDYKAVDGAQTVTFVSKGLSGITTLTVNYADAHELTVQEIIAGGGFYQIGDRRWGLGHAEIPDANAPRPGDEITDADGVKWEVIEPAVLDDQKVSWFVTTRRAR